MAGFDPKAFLAEEDALLAPETFDPKAFLADRERPAGDHPELTEDGAAPSLWQRAKTFLQDKPTNTPEQVEPGSQGGMGSDGSYKTAEELAIEQGKGPARAQEAFPEDTRPDPEAAKAFEFKQRTGYTDPTEGARLRERKLQFEHEETIRRAFKDAMEPGLTPEQADARIASHFEVPLAMVEENRVPWLRAYAQAKSDPKKWIAENPIAARLLFDHPEHADLVVNSLETNLATRKLNEVLNVFQDIWQKGLEAEAKLPTGEATKALRGGLAKVALGVLPLTGTGEEKAAAAEKWNEPLTPAELAKREEERTKERAPVEVTQLDNEEAKRIREEGPAAIAAQRGKEGRLQLEVSKKWAELFWARRRNQDTTLLEAQLHDAEEAATPLALGETGWTQAVAETWGTTQSTLAALGTMVERGGEGALIGGVIGGVGGALATKTPGGAFAGFRTGASFGGRLLATEGGFEASFVFELGDSYPALLKTKTDAGEYLTEQEAAGGALIAATLKAGIEMVELHQIVKALGPAGAAIRTGSLTALQEALATKPAFRKLAVEAAKAAVGEGGEEVSQGFADNITAYIDKSIHDGTWQKGPILDYQEAKANFASSIGPGLLFGGATLGVSTLTHGAKAALDEAKDIRANVADQRAAADLVATTTSHAILEAKKDRAALAGEALADIPVTPDAATMADALADALRKKSAEAGDEFTAAHIDAEAFKRLYQTSEKANEAITELMGPNGPRALASATFTGGKIVVPLEDYIAKWGKDGLSKKLAKDTATRSDRPSANEKEATKIANEEWAKSIADKERKAGRSPTLDRFDEMEKELEQLTQQGHDVGDEKALVDLYRGTFHSLASRFGQSVENLFAGVRISVNNGIEEFRVKHIERSAEGILANELIGEKALPAEARAERALIDPNTELHTFDSFLEQQKENPSTSTWSVTITDIKPVNDNVLGGHDTANALLRHVSPAAAAVDPNAGIKGTNFVGRGGPAELQKALEGIRALLPENFRAEGAVGSNAHAALKAMDTHVDQQRAEKKLPERGTTAADLTKLPEMEAKFSKDVKHRVKLSPAQHARVAKLSLPEYFQSTYWDKVAPTVLSAVGWHHIPRKKFVASMDIKGLKDINALGQDVGDKVLKLFAEVASREGGQDFDFAHLSGDEYAAQHDSKEELDKWLERLEAALLEEGVRVPVTLKTAGGTVVTKLIAAQFRAGVGEGTYGNADRVLNAGKLEEKRLAAEAAAQAAERAVAARSRRDGQVRGEVLARDAGGSVVAEGGAALDGRAGEGAGSTEQAVPGGVTDTSFDFGANAEEADATADAAKQLIAERSLKNPLRAEEAVAIRQGFNTPAGVDAARRVLPNVRNVEIRRAFKAFIDWVENKGEGIVPENTVYVREGARKVSKEAYAAVAKVALTYGLIDPQSGISKLTEKAKEAQDPQLKRAKNRAGVSLDPALRTLKNERAANMRKTVLGRLEQTATVRGGQEKVKGLDPSISNTTRNIAIRLEERQRSKFGTVARDDFKPSTAKRIAKWMATEVAFEFDPKRKAQSGTGWYSEKWQKAIDTFAEEFPELKNDKLARDTFTLLVACTSDGQKVFTNFQAAAKLYDGYRSSSPDVRLRRLDPDAIGSQRSAGMTANFKRINELLDLMTPEELHKYLMEESTVGDIKEAAKLEAAKIIEEAKDKNHAERAAAKKRAEAVADFRSEYENEVKLPRAALELGPKLGAFYANLMGAEGYLTMDRWWSRTFNRYRGQLISSPTETGMARLRELLGDEGKDIEENDLLLQALSLRGAYEARGFKPDFGRDVAKGQAAWDKLTASNSKEAIAKRAKYDPFFDHDVAPEEWFLDGDFTQKLDEDKVAAIYAQEGAAAAGARNYGLANAAWKNVKGAKRLKYDPEEKYPRAAPPAFVEKMSREAANSKNVGLSAARTAVGKTFLEKGGADPEVAARELGYKNAREMLDRAELERAANTVAKAAYFDLEDTPFNPQDRTFMLDTVKEARRVLKDVHGIDVSVADIQAVLWYYEKRLYAELGARSSASVSYEEVSRRVVNKRAGRPESEGLAAREDEEDGVEGPDGASFDFVEGDGSEVGSGEDEVSGDRVNQTRSTRDVLPSTAQEAGKMTRLFQTEKPQFPGTPNEQLKQRVETMLREHILENGLPNHPFDGKRLVAFGQTYEPTVMNFAVRPNFKTKTPELWVETSAGVGRDKTSVDRAVAEVLKTLPAVPAGLLSDIEQYTALLVEQNDYERAMDGWTAGVKPKPPAQVRLGKRWFQEKDEVLGFTDMVRRGTERMFRVGITQKANKSTFLHEAGHVFLELLSDLADRADAPESVQKDWATALQWLGVDSYEELHATTRADGTPLHEKFAEAFEVYLARGEYPAKRLAGPMARFRLWMGEVYRGIKMKGEGTLDPEIAAVFDRLLATDQEIENVKTAAGLKAMPREALGMSPEEYVVHLEGLAKATSHAQLAGDHAVAKDQLRATEDWWKDARNGFIRQAGEEYEALHARQAQKLLKGEEVLGITSTGGITLNRAVVEGWLGAERAKGFKLAEDGIHPDEVVETYPELGYGTGRELVEEVQALPSKEEFADVRADQRMAETYPGVLDDRTRLREVVSKGMHGSATKEWALKEWASLHARAPAGTPTMPSLNTLKLAARLLVADKTAGQLQVATALAGERKAAAAAQKAAIKGDYAQAAAFKQQQVLNMFLHDELLEAKKTVEDFRKLGAKLSQLKARQRLGKADPAYLEGSDTLLAYFGLAEPTQGVKRAVGDVLRDVETKLKEDATTVGFDTARIVDRTLKPASRELWRSLALEDLKHVFNALKNIEAGARSRTTVLVNGRLVAKEKARGELMGEAETALPEKPPEPTDSAKSIGEKVAHSWTAFDGSLLKIETMARWLSGAKDTASFIGSAWFKYVIEPMQQAKARELDLYRTHLAPLVAAWEKNPEKDRGMELVDGKKLFPGHIKERVPKRRFEVLVMLLNSGNESNLSRLTEGRNITEQQLRDAAKAIGVTKDEYAWIQGVWDAAEGLKPLAFDLEEQDSGVRPDEIAPRAFQTEHGEMRGGYFPAVYDRITQVGQMQEARSMGDFADPSFTRPGTSNSSLKKRAENFSDIISLEPGSIQRHFAQTVHDVAFRRAVKSVGNMLLDEDIKRTLRERLGEGRAEQFIGWVADIATQRGADSGAGMRTWEKIARLVRGNIVAAVLGFKLPNALEDFTSNMASAVLTSDLKASHFSAAIYEVSTSPKVSRTFVLEKSGELRARQGSMQRDLAKQIRQLTESGISKVFNRGPLGWYKDHAFAFAEAVDVSTATPIWLGAYRQFLAPHEVVTPELDAAAVTFADATIRQVLPSHNTVDLSALMRNKGPIGYSLMFHGAFNHFYNQFRQLAHDGSGGASAALVARKAGTALGLGIGLFLLGAIARGQGPDKDEPVGVWLMRKMLLEGFMQLTPITGPIGSGMARALRHQREGARSNSLFGVLEGVTDNAIAAADSDNKTSVRVRNAIQPIGPLLGLPVAAPVQSGGPLIDWAMDDNEWRNPFDAASDLTYGKKKAGSWNALQAIGDAWEGSKR